VSSRFLIACTVLTAAMAALSLASAAEPGAASASVQASLAYRTNLNAAQSVGVEIATVGGKRVVQVDGVRLPPGAALLVRDELAAVLTAPAAPSLAPCNAGAYWHVVRRGARESRVQGCLTDRRFERLNAAFLALKRASLL
jgi:hypothetical protein